MTKFFIPIAVFVVIGGFLLVGLRLNPREIPSPLIDKPAPLFVLARLDEPGQTLGAADMKGQGGCSTCGRSGAQPAGTSIRFWSSLQNGRSFPSSD